MPGEVISEPRRGGFSHCGLLLLLVMVLVLVVVEQGVLRRDGDEFRRRRGRSRGSEAPDLAEIRARRERPERGRRGRRDQRNGVVLGNGVGVVGANALAEDEGRGGREEGLVIGDGGERGRCGAGAGGGDDGGLGLAEEPLDGLAVGLVAELTRELEDARRAYDRHANAASAAVDFAVTVLGRRLLNGERGGGGASLVRVGDCVCVVSSDAVSGSVRVGHGGWNWIRACLVAAREKKKKKNEKGREVK